MILKSYDINLDTILQYYYNIININLVWRICTGFFAEAKWHELPTTRRPAPDAEISGATQVSHLWFLPQVSGSGTASDDFFLKKTAWNSVSKKPKHNVWGHVKLQHQIPLVHLWCLKNGNQWAQVERTLLVYLKNGTVHVDIVRPAVPQKPLKKLIILTCFRWLRQICFQTNR